MPEQFALQQVLRDRPAVDRNERAPAALAVVVDGPGDQFLAGAAFAGDQHVDLAGGDLLDQVVDLLHALLLPTSPANE